MHLHIRRTADFLNVKPLTNNGNESFNKSTYCEFFFGIKHFTHKKKKKKKKKCALR